MSESRQWKDGTDALRASTGTFTVRHLSPILISDMYVSFGNFTRLTSPRGSANKIVPLSLESFLLLSAPRPYSSCPSLLPGRSGYPALPVSVIGAAGPAGLAYWHGLAQPGRLVRS